jgi:tetratricopeptide (TPR) repeat protein
MRPPLLLAPLACLLGACAALAPAPEGSEAAADMQQSRLEQRVAALEAADRLYDAGRWREAQQAFESLSTTYPRNAYVWLRLGNAYARLGQYENAAAALQNAVAVEGTHGRAAFNLGLVRLAQAESAFDYARARLHAHPGTRQQAESLRLRVRDLLAQLDRGDHGAEASAALAP